MPVTKREEVTKQGFLGTRKNTPSSGKSLISSYSISISISLSLKQVGWGWALIEFDWEGEGVGWALIRGWALINFFCLQDGRLFEVGANSRLGAYSNKYGNVFTAGFKAGSLCLGVIRGWAALHSSLALYPDWLD